MCETTVDHVPAILSETASIVDSFLTQWLADQELPANLQEAVEYALLGGGKRLRPCLLIQCCLASGGETESALAPAGALELIHAFSLVHDDLPAMDDDELRRGLPTLHIHAGEAMAVLAGDVMMSLAFSLLLHNARSPQVFQSLSQELSQATTAMIAGQVYDTLGGFPDGLNDLEKLQLVHTHKTGALLRGACRMGAIAAGSDNVTIDGITRYGDAIGLMFQITDDLLDVTQSAEHIGKATGKDLEAGKLTYPGVLGIEASQKEIENLRITALESIEFLGPPANPLRDICEFLAVRTK